MTDAQRHCLGECFAKLAKRLDAGEWESITVIHGDCKGVDAQADALARQHGFKTACHPGNIERWRARTGAEELSEPSAPKVRNQRIVDDVVWLIAMPRSDSKGTWMTYGMATQARKPRTAIEMDGTVDTRKGDE
mgnify:CR=1 FL=1